MIKIISSVIILILSLNSLAHSANPRVLVLTKSQGYEHSTVYRNNGQPSFIDQVMDSLAAKNGFSVTNTKDADTINANNLLNYDVVIFYTTGDLTQNSPDGGKPMSSTGPQELVDWVASGRGFVGLHCASDTLHNFLPYIEMLGGEFEWHGNQQNATVKKVLEDPITAHIASSFSLFEEWYMFKNFNLSGDIIPLLVLNSTGMDEQRYRDAEPYPIAWLQNYDQGRVFYNAMGHREDVWQSQIYQEMLVRAIFWAANSSVSNNQPISIVDVPVPTPQSAPMASRASKTSYTYIAISFLALPQVFIGF